MQNQDILSRVRKMADEVAEREGCTVYDIELVGAGKSRVLRLFIDKDAGQGVSIEDCSNVSRGLNLLLDVEDIIPGGEYLLEVSSPGVERVLRERRHFEKALGQSVFVKSFAPLFDFNPERADLAKVRQVSGNLAGVDENGVRVMVANGEVKIPFSTITKAHTLFDFGGQQKAKR